MTKIDAFMPIIGKIIKDLLIKNCLVKCAKTGMSKISMFSTIKDATVDSNASFLMVGKNVTTISRIIRN